MKQNTTKRVLAAIKGFFTKNKGLKLCYLFIIFFLCYAPSFCEHTKITTPSRDAYQLYIDAQGIETEAELQAWERKYQEMELEYSKRYNGATAIKFRIMTQHIAKEAGDRRAKFGAMELAEANAEQYLATQLADYDAAWQIKIGTEEQASKEYAKLLDKVVATHMKVRAAVIEASEFSAKVMEENYTQEQLDKQTALEKSVEELVSKLDEQRLEASQYNLAYRLKYNKLFSDTMLLQRYIAAFDGKNTRYSHSGDKEYGDVMYLAELYSLVGSEEELAEVDKVKEQILEAYRNGVMAGDAENVNEGVVAYRNAAEAHLNDLETINSCRGYIENGVDWDAQWEKILQDRAAADKGNKLETAGGEEVAVGGDEVQPSETTDVTPEVTAPIENEKTDSAAENEQDEDVAGKVVITDYDNFDAATDIWGDL